MKVDNKKLIIAFVVLLIVVVGLLIYMNSGIQYTPKGVNNVAGPVVIKAKENIDTNSGRYDIDPSARGNLQIIDNYIIFWPEVDGGFAFDTEYTATFKEYKTSSGDTIDTISTTFRIGKKTDYSKLQEEVLEKYGVFERSLNPFLEKLPHTEEYRYTIRYIIDEDEDTVDASTYELLGDENNWRDKKDNYTVIIETLVTQGREDSYETYIQEVVNSRQEALNWISAQGVDIEKDIKYSFLPDDATLKDPNLIKDESIPDDDF